MLKTFHTNNHLSLCCYHLPSDHQNMNFAHNLTVFFFSPSPLISAGDFSPLRVGLSLALPLWTSTLLQLVTPVVMLTSLLWVITRNTSKVMIRAVTFNHEFSLSPANLWNYFHHDSSSILPSLLPTSIFFFFLYQPSPFFTSLLMELEYNDSSFYQILSIPKALLPLGLCVVSFPQTGLTKIHLRRTQLSFFFDCP